MQLQSARLSLHPCAPADVATLLNHWRDPEVRRFLFDDLEVERSQVEAFVQTSQILFATHQYGLWCLTDRAIGEFCGVCGLWQGELDQPELLVSVVPASWGQGLGTESSRTVLRYGFEHCRLPEICATVDAPNLASIRLLEKLGFTPRHAPANRSILVYGLRQSESTFEDGLRNGTN